MDGFSSVLVINRVSILTILVSLGLGMLLEKASFSSLSVGQVYQPQQS